MTCGITNLGAIFYVSSETANDDLTLSEFEALTWNEVPNLGTMGDTGISQNVVNYPTWGRPVLCKGKGQADAGDPTVEFQDIASAGMDLMDAYAAFDNANNYGFKIAWPDGSEEYNRGLVTGPSRPKGGNEDFKRKVFTLGLQQAPEIVEAPSTA